MIEASTREDGTFAVGGLPPEAYEMHISRAGYAPVVRPLEVRSEQASLSVELQPSLDPQSVSAGRIVYAREIRAGRYRDITDVLADVAGVSAVGAYSDEPGARGGAWSESELLWNGFRMSDLLTRHPYSRIELNAVERVSVKHAAFDVEYGDVPSSVMKVTTRKVGDDYLGYAEVQYRPPGRKHFGPMMFGFDSPVVEPYVDREAGAFSGNRFFPGWEAMTNRQLRQGIPHYYEQLREGDSHYGDQEELYALWLWRHRSPDAIAELKQLPGFTPWTFLERREVSFGFRIAFQLLNETIPDRLNMARAVIYFQTAMKSEFYIGNVTDPSWQLGEIGSTMHSPLS